LVWDFKVLFKKPVVGLKGVWAQIFWFFKRKGFKRGGFKRGLKEFSRAGIFLGEKI